MVNARLAEIGLPDFRMPGSRPEVPEVTYAARIERLRLRAEEGGYDQLVVYADREHSAGLSYLTGFDPRFEEAILVLGPSGDPALLVGNECQGLAAYAPLKMRTVLFQDLSLPGQPRDRSAQLAEILAGEGIGTGQRVGVIGWKTYSAPEAIDAPAFLVDELRRLTRETGAVENVTGILIDAADGLGVINQVGEP